MLDLLREFALNMFNVNSFWSVVLRAVVWFLVAGVIIVSTDNANPDNNDQRIRHNLGFFLLFLVLSGGLIFLLFSYVPSSAA